tara:strand:- start:4076 stop:4504 length:429 start_codon:yes stop_codon:yes gene_type:complete
MSNLSQFNTALSDFLVDLKSMSILSGEISKLETYMEVTRINARAIISNFQTHILRDIFVKNVLKNNVDFFVNYDASKDIPDGDNTALGLIQKIQEIVRKLVRNNEMANINCTLKWLKILCYHAYQDIGIDAANKFSILMKEN